MNNPITQRITNYLPIHQVLQTATLRLSAIVAKKLIPENFFRSLYAKWEKTPSSCPEVRFDLQKMDRIYKDYTSNYHPGVVLVMGHPFTDKTLCDTIISIQKAIGNVFLRHELQDLVTFYDLDQVHAAITEVAGQHDKTCVNVRRLKDYELNISHRNNKPMDINYVIELLGKTKPFKIELGPGVLGNDNEMLKITDLGQFLIKGKPEDRELLVKMREELENKANIIYKYPKNPEFHSVIGYTKPDPRLNTPQFLQDLATCIHEQRSKMQRLVCKVDHMRILAFESYSLAKSTCFWEREFKLNQNCDLDLLEKMHSVMGTK